MILWWSDRIMGDLALFNYNSKIKHTLRIYRNQWNKNKYHIILVFHFSISLLTLASILVSSIPLPVSPSLGILTPLQMIRYHIPQVSQPPLSSDISYNSPHTHLHGHTLDLVTNVSNISESRCQTSQSLFISPYLSSAYILLPLLQHFFNPMETSNPFTSWSFFPSSLSFAS